MQRTNAFSPDRSEFRRDRSSVRNGLHLLWALGFMAVTVVNGLSAAEPAAPAEEKLIAVLKSGTASHHEKGEACRQLAVIGTEASVPALGALLADERLSHLARFALEPMPNAAAGAALRDALVTLKGLPLVGVINSIGVRQDPQAIGALTKLLSSPDAGIAAAAAAALGRIGNADCAQALQGALANGPANQRGAVADGGLVCAERLLAAGDRGTATRVYDALRQADVARHIQMAALRGAILARGPAGSPLLIEQLRSSDAPSFAVGLKVARELAGAEITKSLAAEMGRLPESKQALLVAALGDRADAEALPVVVEAAQRGGVPVRVAAIRALPKLGKGSSVSILLEAAAEGEAEVAQAARVELARLQGKEVDAALLASVNEGGVPVRRAAIELVAQRRVASATPVLLKAAVDSNAKIRVASIRALGETVGADDFGGFSILLVKAHEAEELSLTEEAVAKALVRAKNKNACAETLLALLPQAKPEVRRALLRLLVPAGGARALQAVRTAVQDSDVQVRETAVRALADWLEAGAAPDLLEIVRHSENTAHRALAFRGQVRLAREGEMPAEARLKMLGEVLNLAKTVDEKKLVLGALGEVPSVEALRLVTPNVADAALADEAGAAVVKLAVKLDAKHKAEVIPALQAVVKSAKAKSVVDDANQQLQRLSKAK